MFAPAAEGHPFPARPVWSTRFPLSRHSETIVVTIFITLWYAFTIVYNITNKRALNAIKLPWSIGSAQLVVGTIYVLPLWILGIRDAPRLTMDNVEGLIPIAMCHVLSLVCVTASLGAGAHSLVHIVKATEPLFTALLSAIFLEQTFSPLVYLTLALVVVGVGLACFKELGFTWLAFVGAVGYTLAVSTRMILSKRAMGMDMGNNMSPANLYAVVSIMALAMFLPLSAILEGHRIMPVWAATVDSPEKEDALVFEVVVSGMSFYVLNEMSFRCLGRVHPVTHALGSTFKRIFLVITSVVVFGSELTLLSKAGCYLAIVGVQWYRLARVR